MTGQRIVVTGGGGSIGSEICARAVAFGASAVLVLESSEPALHGVLSRPGLSGQEGVSGVIADIRDRDRLFGCWRNSGPTTSSTPRP